MTWHDRLSLTGGIAVTLLPFLVSVMLLVRRGEYLHLTKWRYWMAMSGLGLALIAGLPVPVFYFVLEFPQKVQGDWLPAVAGTILTVGFFAGLAAMILLAFANGRVRWLGIAVTFVSMAFLYVTLLGLSA